MSSLKEIAGNRLINDMFERTRSSPNDWKVLVIDAVATRVLGSAVRMFDLTTHGITVVEKLELNRQPLLNFEAIYFVSATDNAIDQLIADFANSSRPLYKGVHLFTTSALSDSLFEKLSKSKASPFLKTVNEFNLDFLALEAQAFSLANEFGTYEHFSPNSKDEAKTIGEQLATVCATLKDQCYVGYYKNSDTCEKIANATNKVLNDMAKDGDFNANDGDRGQLIVVDRFQDVLTPILHDLHYQAMVYDLLEVDGKDVYKYEASGKTKEVVISEHDDLWSEVRHMHIGDTIATVDAQFKDFKTKNKTANAKKDNITAAELSDLLKAMPQHQKDVLKYGFHVQCAEACMSKYGLQNIETLSKIEQDLVVGETPDGEKVSTKDIINNILEVLGQSDISVENKTRLLMAYVTIKQGVAQNDLNKMMERANLSQVDKESITNLNLCGVKVTNDDKGGPKPFKRIERNRDGWFVDSRWVPVVKDVMEYCLEGKHEKADIEFVGGAKPSTSSSKSFGGSASSNRTRTPIWADKKGKQTKTDTFAGPRLVIFVAGGVSYAELRCAYEITKATNRQVIIGSTNLLKPVQFMSSIKNLKKTKHDLQLADLKY